MQLEDFINNITPLPEKVLLEVKNKFKKKSYLKGTQIIEQGKTCKYLYYIDKGLARSYYINEKGKDITVWFFSEDNIMTGVESFFQQKPSMYEIEFLEDSVVYQISYDDLNELFDKYHIIERFGRLLAIQLLTDMADKLNAMQFQSAKERYLFMIKKFPNISYRAPLGHIASYLGITQETLSRIRSRI